jgi:hypothetical protein
MYTINKGAEKEQLKVSERLIDQRMETKTTRQRTDAH